ncbi:PRG4 [Symbiodinium natans]|uniref:PRG4 protein n=1 Tax=Symbiodinium natans TaxID=878477 RepID=A0A812NI67_9DINO|nr:PRG4 [Symbiodinium natans]
MASWCLLLLAASAASAAAQLCKDQGCIAVFRSGAECQCFPGCDVYEDCCSDYATECFDSKGRFRTTVTGDEFASQSSTTSHHPQLRHKSWSTSSLRSASASCVDRGCSQEFEPDQPCQCNSACVNHDSCCHDFLKVCGAKISAGHPDVPEGSCRTYGCADTYVGGQSCQCNPGCTLHNNCCQDYSDECPSQSQGALHGAGCKSYGCGPFDAAQSCQCNEVCLNHGNCCEDYQATCAANTKATSASCSSYGCGPFSVHQACQCNAGCLQHRNCCPDFEAQCLSQNRVQGRSSCAELGCGSSGPLCQCNEGCMKKGDCCADYEATCHLPKQPLGSCAILGCITFRQGNDCQCNVGCEKHGNCCVDYSSFCGVLEESHGTILQ